MAGLSLVLVRWADAHSGIGHWHELETTGEDDAEYLVQSVGWLIPADKGGKHGHVTLAQSLTPDDMVDHILHIPKGMVRQMVVAYTTTGEPLEADNA